MTTATRPLPPTDGSHPHAQPVVYAHRIEHKNHAADWVQSMRYLLRDVATNPTVRREIDKELTDWNRTSRVKREFLAMHGGGGIDTKPKPKTLAIGKAEKPVPVAERPNKPRNRQYVPTGSPKGRPKSAVAVPVSSASSSRCVICDSPFVSIRSGHECCSVRCRKRKANAAAKGREVFHASEDTCICGAVFTKKSSRHKYCSWDCKQRDWNAGRAQKAAEVTA